MKRLAYISSEIIAIYAILMTLTVGVFLLVMSPGDLRGLLILAFSMLLIPQSIFMGLKGASILVRPRRFSRHRSRPVRPIAFLLNIRRLLKPSDEPHPSHLIRAPFTLPFNASKGQSSEDILLLLARHLEAQNIRSILGTALYVEDNRSNWRVESVSGATTVTGIIRAPLQQDVDKIMQGLKQFLSNPGTLDLDVELARA